MKRGKRSERRSRELLFLMLPQSKSSKTAAKTIILLMLLALLSFFFLSLAKAPTWVLTETQSDFNEGNYTNVSSNSTGVVKFIRELPNDQSDESASGGANMTGSVLLMHLNNDSGVGDNTTWTYDYSGNGNNGTISGATWTTSGKFGSALEFDGSNDRVYDINLGHTTEFRTLMLWVYQPSYQSLAYTGLFSDRYAGLRIDPGANAELNFYCSPTGCSGGHLTSNYNMPTGEWVHVALTFNGTNILWYKNGAYIEASDLSGYPSSDVCECESLASDGTWSLAHNEGDNRYFNGSIDEVAIYNRSLSAAEISAHYNKSVATHGTYESKVYDANSTVSWKNLSWTEGVPYQEELPNDQTDESLTTLGGANMSGNVLLMHFNNDSAYGENNTRAYDFSGNGNNGTAVDNAAPTSAGKFNGAFTFDGSGDYIDCGNDSSLDITGEITISVWVFAKDTSINPILEKSNAYSTGEGYNIYYYNNGNTYVNIESGQHLLGCAGLIHTNTWDHLAFTFNGSHAVLYQNGIEKCSSDVAYNLDPSTDPLTIGTYARTVPNDYFNGIIDEVAIWNRSLSAAEILEHYKRGALNMTFQVRSDNDNATWMNYIGPDNTSSSYFTNATLANLSLTNLSNARYFQYKAYFETNNTAYTPELWNVSSGYGIVTPTATLNSPNGTYHNSSTVSFNCSADGVGGNLVNISLYTNTTGTWELNDTNSVTGTSNSTNFTVSGIPDGSHAWNCLAYNDAPLSAFASANYTFTVDTTFPQINFTDPTEASGNYITKNYTYVNVTVSDANNVSSFINWNNSLVGYWNFENVVGGVVYDNSTYGNNGTMSGFTSNTTTSGKFGNALEFDGVDDYIAVDSLASTSQTYTFSMWVKSSAPDTQYDYLFSSTPPYLIFAWNTNTVGQLGFYDGSFHDFGNTPNDGNWHHLALILDSSLGNGILYLDGTQFGSTQSYTGRDISGTVTLGNQRIDGAEFNGTIDEVAIWNRALSEEEINASYNTGLYSLYHNFTDLADGNYSYYAQSIDLVGNINQTETRTLAIDTTAPAISLTYPANNSYLDQPWINITGTASDTNNDTIYINDTRFGDNTGTYASWNFTNNTITEGTYSVLITANDSANNTNSTNVVFTIDRTDPHIAITYPANNSNLSQIWINITGTASDGNTDTVYVNDTRFGDNTGTYASWNFTNTTIADGTYSILITANDSAGKTNSTNIIFTIDATAPSITNMSISPSAAADIDPNVNINVTVNVTDAATGIDTIILRYWNYSTNVSTSSNVTMSSAGGDLFNASFNASVNGTWYYQVWANDSAGNSINNTPNSTDVQYECTWEISDTISDPTLGAFETTDVIGNITINNTGDASYPIHSCTLSFILTDNLATGRISYSPSDAVISLAAKDTSTVNITATFLNKVVSEGLVITITDYGRKSATYQTTSNATLTSYAGGPYLNVVINSSLSAVNQTDDLNFTLSVYVQNIGNESASNVTLNWTLPTGWGNLSGLLNVNVSTLNCSDPTISPSSGCDTNASLNTLVNLITATVSNPNTASIGTVTIYANTSSESKVNSSCSSNCSYVNASDSATATVSCYAVSDGVCPTSGTCSYDSTANNYDPDCTAPAAETITTGGGGGAGAAPAAIVAEAIYELVRGKDESFSLEVKNTFKDASLRDVKIKVEGFLAQYITVEPATLEEIAPNSAFNFTIRITAPAYFTVGKHDLTFTISSVKEVGVMKTARTEKRYVTLAIHELGREDAAQLVSSSKDAIAEMLQLDLNVKKVQQLLAELEAEFEKSNYENVKEISQSIKTIKENALQSHDTIASLQEKITDAENMGIKAEDTKILLNLAIAAFERGDYALALERAKDAEMTYAVETKGEFNLFYFVANNTIECLVGIIILTFLSALLFLKVKLSITNHSITSLYSEQDILLGLMKTVQHECFIEKKMSMGEYRQSMLEYEDRFSKAVQHALKLESIKANLFKLKKKGLEMERQGILKLMKELQSKYIKEGKVETRVYDQKMQSFTARLSEIEEQIALNEAKRALHRAKRRRFLRRFGLPRSNAAERLARKKKQTEHKRMKLKEKIKRRFESVIKKATEKKEKELDRKRKEQIERAKEEAPKQRKKEKLREKIRKRFERVIEREEKKRAKSRKK